MSTRTSRKSASASASSTHEHVPVISPPMDAGDVECVDGSSAKKSPKIDARKSGSKRTASPISESRRSRQDEKIELQNLNNRFACYIDKIRSYEMSFDSIRNELSLSEDAHVSEIERIKTEYDDELARARKALDEEAQTRTQFQISSQKLDREVKELRAELENKDRDLVASDKRTVELTAKLIQAEKELKQLKPESNRLKTQLKECQKLLEDETTMRVDVQNRLRTAEECLVYKSNMFEHSLSESRSKRQRELADLSGQLNQQYEDRLQESLMEMRDTYEAQQEDNREEFVRIYESKAKVLQGQLDVARAESVTNNRKILELTNRVNHLTSSNTELEAMNAAVRKRYDQLESGINATLDGLRAEIERKDETIHAQEEEISGMTKDFERLLELKVSLDMEIKAFRKMLESEEERVGLTSFEDSAPRRGIKRKRLSLYGDMEEEAKFYTEHSETGELIIDNLDESKDNVISVTNQSSTQSINIGGWVLSNSSGDVDSMYKFHRSTTLDPGATCKVWASDSKEEHIPPLNLVMKKGGWNVTYDNVITLLNKEGIQVATRKCYRERRYGRFRRSVLAGSVSAQKDSQSCIVM